jgi:NDP-sugar pyrophosphorylase family protein
MHAVILAGGKGTRLRPLTLHTPKPVLPIVGQPFLFYQLELLKRVGIKDVVLSLSYQPQKIEDVFGDGSRHGVKLRYTFEPQPLGTAGAFRSARGPDEKLSVVLNGDILTDVDLGPVIAFHRERRAAVTIVLAAVDEPRAYGVAETGEDGRIRRFLEKPTGEIAANTINAGIYLISHDVVDRIPDGAPYSFEYDLFPALVEEGAPVYGYVTNRYWTDIGTPHRLLQANLDMLAGKLPSAPMLARERGERVDEKASIDELSWIDPTATVKAGARIVNSVVEAHCFIEEKAVVENCVLRRSTRVSSQGEIRSSIVGMSCHIGRFTDVERVALGDKSVLTDYSASGDFS